VDTLDGLGQLHWIANQHEILGAGRRGNRIRQRDLSGLVDEQEVESFSMLLAREEPRGAADKGPPSISIVVGIGDLNQFIVGPVSSPLTFLRL
jgi:hypothetical protein